MNATPAPEPARDAVLAVPRDASISADEFKRLFRSHPGGIAVVTADAGTGPVALTVTSLASVSAEPPIMIFSVSAHSSSLPTLQSTDTLVIHLLGPESLELARLASTSGVDRFAERDAWSRLPTGEPRYHGVASWVRGRVIHRLSAGGSTIVVVEALQAGFATEGDEVPAEGLVYRNRSWHRIDESTRIDD